MSEKKKLSTAEILAMARKGAAADSGGSKPEEPAASEPTAAAEPKPAKADKPAAAKPAAAKPAAGGRPSVADILAAARAGAGAKPAEAKPVAPAAEKPKPAKAEPKPKPKATAEEAAPAGGPKDTASILAAARKAAKPGPMSKEEAASRQPSAEKASAAAAAPARPAAKTKPTVPPMPAKPSAAKPKAAKGAPEEDRRGFISFMLGTFLGLGFSSLAATLSLWGLGTARFMFPNILTEPPSQFKVGFPADFPPGSVADKFKAQFGVWVVNYEYNGQQEIYALRTVCTHLGCTPNWLEGEQKFKCPCHGSGFYKDGINFEGPAPRPLERYAIRLADDGQLEIDKSKLFQQELGQWNDPSCYVPV